MAKGETSLGPVMLFIAVGLVAAVIAGMTYIPPYFANLEVVDAVKQVLNKADPTTDDTTLIDRMNVFLTSASTTRFWVEDHAQRHAIDFQLTPDLITFTRDGNHQLSADVQYAQHMWIPILGRDQAVTFQFHVDGPVH